MFYILSIDGGGCKGMIAAELIRNLYIHHPELYNSIDCFVGVSSGSIIAAMLAAGYEPDKALEIFETEMSHIFRRSWKLDLCSFGGLCRPRYSNFALWDSIYNTAGDLQMGSLVKKFICYSYDAQRKSPIVHLNHSDRNVDDRNTGIICNDKLRLVDVVYQSCLAPTYFKSNNNGTIDGSIICNNPTMIAVSVAHKYYGIPMEEIRVISLGTRETIRPPIRHFGSFWYWLKNCIWVMMEASLNHADIVCNLLLDGKYLRIDVPCNYPIDCHGKRDILIEMGKYAYFTHERDIVGVFNGV